MMDETSIHMAVAGHEKDKKELLRKRIHHLESSMWSYESAKGKGSWKRDNPTAAKLLDSLLKQNVDATVAEVKAEMGPEKGSKGAAPEGPEKDSQAMGSNAGNTKSDSSQYTFNAPKVKVQNWGSKKK